MNGPYVSRLRHKNFQSIKMTTVNLYLFSHAMENLFVGSSRHLNFQVQEIADLSDQEYDESTWAQHALEVAPSGEACLIIGPNMVTHCSPANIVTLLEYMYLEVKEFDIMYLSRWADRCDLYTDMHELYNFKIVETQSPFGISGFLLSARGLDIYRQQTPIAYQSLTYNLNKYTEKVLKAYTTLPPVFDYDMTQRHETRDFVKSLGCRQIHQEERPPEISRLNTTNLNLFWFILVLAVIITIAVIMISLTDKLRLPIDLEGGQGSSLPHSVNIRRYISAPNGPMDPTGDLKTFSVA